MSRRNYYDILNVHPSASFEEIRANYKQLILQCHPDKLHDDIKNEEATIPAATTTATNVNAIVAADPIQGNSVTVATNNDSKFVEINKAWNTLKDSAQRKLYDAELLANRFHTHSNIFARLKLADLNVVVVNDNHEGDDGKSAASAADDSTKLYTYNCRCGGQYVVDESADKEIFDTGGSNNIDVLVECSECSLAIILNG